MKHILILILLSFSFISYATENKSEDDGVTTSACGSNSKEQVEQNVFLVQKGQCSNYAIREAAARSLGQIQPDKYTLLAVFLHDSHYKVRKAAVRSLGKIINANSDVDAQVLQALTDTLKNDSHYEVRLVAAQVIGTIGSRNDQSRLALVSALYDPNDSVREAAARSLAKIPTDESVNQVINKLASSTGLNEPEWAIWVLRELKEQNNCQDIQKSKNFCCIIQNQKCENMKNNNM